MSLIMLADIPTRGADKHGRDAWAIRHSGDVISWGELEDRALRRAHSLRNRGIGVGDLVTLALPNGSAIYEWLFALWRIGATPHVVSYRLPEVELRAIIDVARPAMVVASDPQLQNSLGAFGAELGLECNDLSPLEPVLADNWKAMSSGGSTGRPKIIVAPGPNAFDDQKKPPLRFPNDGPILATGPIYHNMPMTTNLQALFEGHPVVGMERFDPEEALRLIDEYSIAWTSFVPTMMMRISRLPEAVRSQYDVFSLKTVWHWAAPMPPELKQEWIDWLGPETIWELYGGTEGIVTAILNGAEWLAHRGSVGRAVGSEIKIVDDNGDEVPQGKIGEIFALPASGAGSTYNYIGAERRTIAGGFETIGDFGWIDEDGYLYIADRRTDMIVSGGANVFPAEVEGALMAHPAVAEAVVIGLPDADFGARVHAIIQVIENPEANGVVEPDEASLVAFLKERIVTYKIPRSFEFTRLRLRDDAGKVRRQQLREERLVQSADS